MTAPFDDEPESGFVLPAAWPDEVAGIDELHELDDGDGRDEGTHGGAHAQPVEIPPVEGPRNPIADRPKYFLSSLEPSGEFDAVIVAVTDGARRRYFTTRDGVRLVELDEGAFERRSEGGARSLLELDERELGELEAELRFVRPVRGRDPIAEAAAEATGAGAEAQEVEAEPRPEADAAAEPGPDDAAHPVPAHATAEDAPVQPETDDETDSEENQMATDAGAGESAEAPTEAEEVDRVTEEFEEIVLAARRSTFEVPRVATAAPDAAGATSTPDVAGATEPDATPASPPAALPASDAIEQVALARGIAFIAHRGQLDRNGAPYVDHPGRIAERFDPATEPIEAASAWLHDVLEDTPITAQELFEAGVLPEIIDVVQLLTRTPDVASDEYYARIRVNPIARRVKLADIDDNTARWRLRRLDYEVQLRLIEKYRLARRALGSA
ncbi:hypothetical protein [Agromyces bauzanensis]|uniref:HD domain-containing protein n=1 Tax=Agromyces bauzanensis TaxID=1308924 RepID=A0A917PDU0_9MICO|nr:hypothetical protein [Agromyces bauzanensis]GGJ72221.1 hypothetical protein GCM10011372_07750 [Agromyces bauzanensis]